jgi:hypothetical protein
MGLMSSTPNNNLIRPPHQNSSPLTLTIWQQNVNKSSTCQHDLISSARLAKRGIDLVALQEPSINTFGTTIASRDWIPIYPTTHSAALHKTCHGLPDQLGLPTRTVSFSRRGSAYPMTSLSCYRCVDLLTSPYASW